MKKKYNNILKIVFPSKKINIFVICIVILGVTFGAIFANMLGLNDQNQVIDKIKLFTNNINNNLLDNVVVFKNSLGINIIYTAAIWILGMTLIGIILVIGLLFIKSFIFGFSMASFIITFKYKGIFISILYLLFGQLFNIVAIIILSIYSIMFTIKLFKLIFKNNPNNHNILKFFKNYLLILIIVIIINVISSLCETFILPALIKLIIKLYL